jgi:hypothetical protein
MSTAFQGHERIDRRSLGLHRAIAEKLRANPELLAIAYDNLDRWSVLPGGSQPYWDAWREILRRPLNEIINVMLEENEHMTAMRQATPFAGILTPKERWAIYEEFGRKQRENP